MARIEFDVENLSFAELAELDDETQYSILEPGAEVAREGHKRTLLAMGLVQSGQLYNSLKIQRKRAKDGSVYVLVMPSGKRTPTIYHPAPNTNNSTVGFFNEFGAPLKGIPAKEWMRTANEQYADAVLEAEEAAYDKFLKSKGF